MLEVLISVPTLLICTLLSTLVVAVFLTQYWLTERGPAAARFWCVAMWIGTASSALLATRETIAPELSIGLGNFLAALAYSLTWAGFRAFEDRHVSRIAIAAGPAAWSLAYLFSDTFAADMSLRVILMSLVVSGYSLGIATELLSGRRREALPSRRIIAVLLASHGVIYLLRIPFALVAPVTDGAAPSVSPWFAIFALEIFLHTLIVAVAMLVLIKERSEFVFRYAARSDALTGILNRGAFMDDVSACLLRRPDSGVLMLFDLDHFKSINDTYGHMAGDQVLRRFTSAVSALIDDDMIFGRFGGEEFALFAPALDLEHGLAAADRIRRDVARLSIGHFGETISITISAGIASVVLSGGDLDRMVAAADHALYRAKAEGRDRVNLAGPAESLMQVAGRMRGPEPGHAEAEAVL